MAKSFSETTRSIKADRLSTSLMVFLMVLIFLAGWSYWFIGGSVATWEISTHARLEVSGKSYRVDAPIAGKVAGHIMKVGKEVKKDEALVYLETGALRLQEAEEQAQLSSYLAQLAATQGQAAATVEALDHAQEEQRSQQEKTEAELKAAEAEVAIKQDLVSRYQQLSAKKMISELTNLEARSQLEKALSSQQKASLTLKNYRTLNSSNTHELKVSQAQIEGRLATLQGAIAKSRVTLQRLATEAEQYTVRAPVDGRLGAVIDRQAGAYVAQGTTLCSVVPLGKPRVLSHFSAGVALGRIRPGQRARVRLDGFPWAEYGSLEARVSRVGSEPRDGDVQVDLDLLNETSANMPLQHGMPGSVQIQIESQTPLELVLRALGKRLQPSRQGPSS